MNKGKGKVKAVIAGISVVAVVGVAGIIAYFTDTAQVTNKAKMGIVDIDLEEYTINDQGQKVAWTDLDNVVPGEVISKIPEISVVEGAVDCYVRAKVEISNDDDELAEDDKMLSLEDINVDTTKWLYKDGYFYYKQKLSDSDDPIVLFSEVTIPSDLGNDWSLSEFSIDITVEAIQSQNFTPDFSESTTNPWPGITADDIEVCKYPTHVKS